MGKILKGISYIIAVSMLVLAGLCFWLVYALPEDYLVTEGHELHFSSLPYVTVQSPVLDGAVANVSQGNSYNVQLKLMGVIPVKTVRAQVVEGRVVNVYGTPFGIKMFSDGVMVVGFSDIYTSSGYKNPAKTAGIRMGDLIKTINGKKTSTNEDVGKIVSENGGNPVTVVFERNGETFTVEFTPAMENSTRTYRAGMWVRDSSAGLGTLTFVDEESGVFAGLGHSITDVDTGSSIPLLSGEIVEVQITGIVKGASGMPGELKGCFPTDIPSGTIAINNQTGVYGRNYTLTGGTTMQVRHSQEIHTGNAQILTTIDGRGPRLYDIVIEKLVLGNENPNKNMIIRVTDTELLQKTGGIIQGMSGSPIIQDGYFIGAVTHVLVNDPTRGYGIFSENMIATADSVKELDKVA
ncbi:MAG: SpoIVB peptidase [Oscillospiraceae bacterium]|nr:SpoIVB peptidase [Oscillospiraceae bacterium]